MSASKILSLFFFIVTLLFNPCLSHGGCNEDDKNVLLRIKRHFNNPSSLSSWTSKTDCSFWPIIGTNYDGRVTLIRILDGSDIHGSIPSFLYKLPFLSVLDFSDIPNLSGTIPPSIGKLRNLTQLFISNTSVSGPIPYSFGQLTKLKLMLLDSNWLNGSIPSTFVYLNKLEFISLNSNNISGPIPHFMSRLKKLNYIGLESNNFSGPIPASLSLLSKLTTINLAHNKLTGPLPNPLAQVNTLMILDLSNNLITGDASFLFDKNYTNLGSLYLNNNRLKFDFSSVSLTPSLFVFNISHNMIYGSLPKRFGQMRPDLDHVDVSYNQLCGPIPNGRRFKRADPAIFANNRCLCGGPLHACK